MFAFGKDCGGKGEQTQFETFLNLFIPKVGCVFFYFFFLGRFFWEEKNPPKQHPTMGILIVFMCL